MRLFRRTLALVTVLSFPLSFTALADEETGGDIVVPPATVVSTPVQVSRTAEPEAPVTAVAPPHVLISSTSVAAGIGLSWGDGTLRFEGEEREFSLRGFRVLDLGASITESLGEVYNLNRLEDFEGTYVAVEAAGAAGSGASAMHMRNAKGVEIELRSELRGAQLTLATQGLSIRFK